eukprot:5660644-Heterocapsa_arctica.AAC.1
MISKVAEESSCTRPLAHIVVGKRQPHGLMSVGAKPSRKERILRATVLVERDGVAHERIHDDRNRLSDLLLRTPRGCPSDVHRK